MNDCMPVAPLQTRKTFRLDSEGVNFALPWAGSDSEVFCKNAMQWPPLFRKLELISSLFFDYVFNGYDMIQFIISTCCVYIIHGSLDIHLRIYNNTSNLAKVAMRIFTRIFSRHSGYSWPCKQAREVPKTTTKWNCWCLVDPVRSTFFVFHIKLQVFHINTTLCEALIESGQACVALKLGTILDVAFTLDLTAISQT